MIPAGELTEMRTVSELTFDQSCAIKRSTPTSNGFGGQTVTWATSSTKQCHIRETGPPVEAIVDPALRGASYFTVWLPWDADVRAADRLVIGSYTYEVTERDVGKSYNLTIQVRAVRVEI